MDNQISKSCCTNGYFGCANNFFISGQVLLVNPVYKYVSACANVFLVFVCLDIDLDIGHIFCAYMLGSIYNMYASVCVCRLCLLTNVCGQSSTK